MRDEPKSAALLGTSWTHVASGVALRCVSAGRDELVFEVATPDASMPAAIADVVGFGEQYRLTLSDGVLSRFDNWTAFTTLFTKV